MTAPVKLNFKVYQGSTFNEVLRWESATKVYKVITAISRTAPMVVTANAHGAPIGWRVKLSNIVGMVEANALDYITVTDTAANTLTINSINAAGFKNYVSGGILEYNQPYPLAGVTARLQVREKITSDVVILELTTENGGITINDSLKTITINIVATATALLTFKAAVYSMELISGAVVTPFINGTLTLETEITR